VLSSVAQKKQVDEKIAEVVCVFFQRTNCDFDQSFEAERQVVNNLVLGA
jgi:hypothetical protein